MVEMKSDAVACACQDCVCKVAPGKGIEREGKTYCCEACADGHAEHVGCDHNGCACHG